MTVRSAAATPAAGRSVLLRPFPYPFRAALAISSDADLMTPDGFRRLHTFLNTATETEWGPGLELQVGGSFFMYSSPDSPNTFTVFDRLSNRVTGDGEYIIECVRRGLLDVIHTYGCFTDITHFTRELAEIAVAELRSRGVRLDTWVNHGPPTNVQCVGELVQVWQGDMLGTPAYHADLTVGLGVRWFWTGAEITDRIALDTAAGADWRHGAWRRWIPGIPGRMDCHAALVEPYRLRDGQEVRRFYRYGGLDGRTPVLDDLPQQLSSANLDQLVRAGGCTIIYQHLAVRRRRPGFGPTAYGRVDESWFRPAEVAALRDLAQRRRDGAIWVVPTTRLLRYREARHSLVWESRRDDGVEAIVLTAPGPGRAIQLGDLHDITFYCAEPERTRVFVQTERELAPIKDVRANPPDATSRPSLTVMPGAGLRDLP